MNFLNTYNGHSQKSESWMESQASPRLECIVGGLLEGPQSSVVDAVYGHRGPPHKAVCMVQPVRLSFWTGSWSDGFIFLISNRIGDFWMGEKHRRLNEVSVYSRFGSAETEFKIGQ
jgi:hypothetical protein